MTDTIETGRRPCPCGKGEIVDFRETPDHGWSSGQWVRGYSRVECPDCDAMYLVSGDGFILRSDYEARELERRAVWEQEKVLINSAPVVKIFERLALRIDQEPSVAAAHRLLSQHGLTSDTINTFRRKWRGGEDWIKRHGGSYLLKKLREIGALTKEKHAEIISEMERLKALREIADRPLPLVDVQQRTAQ
jgi:hypothetical protein